MKTLITMMMLMSSVAFAEKETCTDRKGNTAKINGLTLTIWSANKCIATVKATKAMHSPMAYIYIDESTGEELFSMNRKGRLHQGGRVDVTTQWIQYRSSKFHCK